MTVTGLNFEGTPAVKGLSGQQVTVVEDACFCISEMNGDIAARTAQGLFYRDTRFVSAWSIEVGGFGVEPLSAEVHDPFAATFVTRSSPPEGRADSTLLVVRKRLVGSGMREDLTVENFSSEPAECLLTVRVDADFAHIFEVKEGRTIEASGTISKAMNGELMYLSHRRGRERALVVRSSGPATVRPGVLELRVTVPAKGRWEGSFQLELSMDGNPVVPWFASGASFESCTPAVRLHSWRRGTPSVQGGNEQLTSTIAQSIEDLGALRIFDQEVPERAMVAAGSPWFMTLFGRDALLTSWMTLLIDPSLAVGTLRALARLQGDKVDTATEEQPGRILHEVRWGTGFSKPGGDVYYGSIDATPLFVMLVGELRRWGLAEDVVTELLPHADRALAWVEEFGDRDKDGFVEYMRLSDRGLLNQGWKDSFDGINFSSGRVANPPIALCEVQGYVYAAYVARANLADEAGDHATVQRYRSKATDLKAAFNDAFWLPEHGWFAVGLDAQKKAIDSLTSNVGHCLWTGIVDPDKAAQVADHLMSPKMFTGWGIRTLASSMGSYNPMSYHNGSVWPHDTAIVAAGLMRYGFVEESQLVAVGLLEAAERFGYRLPELFCGFERSEFEFPVPYPTSCSPQAWAAASVFSLLRTLLGFEPSIPRNRLWLQPHLPEEFGSLRIANVPLAERRLTIEVSGDDVKVDGLPPGIRLMRETSPGPFDFDLG